MGYSLLLHPQNQETGLKLGLASFLMCTLPISSFYFAMWFFSDKKSPENWAGGVAIVTTNLIVGGYCYAAYIEDADDGNDENAPRTGMYKQRTD